MGSEPRCLTILVAMIGTALLVPFGMAIVVFVMARFAPSSLTAFTYENLFALVVGGLLFLSFTLLVRGFHGIVFGRLSAKDTVRWFFLAVAGIAVAIGVERVLGVVTGSVLPAPTPSAIRIERWSPLHRFDLADWTVVAMIWVGVLLVAVLIGQSGVLSGGRRRVAALAPLATFMVAWAIFADTRRLPFGQILPSITPEFLSVWGLAMLGLLPLLFFLVGGLHAHEYHPKWAPLALLTKLASLTASALSIWSFYVRNSW